MFLGSFFTLLYLALSRFSMCCDTILLNMYVCVLVIYCHSLLGLFLVWLKASLTMNLETVLSRLVTLVRLFMYVLRIIVYISCWLVCNDAYHLFSLSKLFVT